MSDAKKPLPDWLKDVPVLDTPELGKAVAEHAAGQIDNQELTRAALGALGRKMDEEQLDDQLARPEAILESISEDELRMAVTELHVSYTTGLMPDGKVLELTRRLHVEVGMPTQHARSFVEAQVLRRAAFKWAGRA